MAKSVCLRCPANVNSFFSGHVVNANPHKLSRDVYSDIAAKCVHKLGCGMQKKEYANAKRFGRLEGVHITLLKGAASKNC